MGLDLSFVHTGIEIPRRIVLADVLETEPIIAIELVARFRRLVRRLRAAPGYGTAAGVERFIVNDGRGPRKTQIRHILEYGNTIAG